VLDRSVHRSIKGWRIQQGVPLALISDDIDASDLINESSVMNREMVKFVSQTACNAKLRQL
jgi:hypothetical protein